MRLRSSSTPSRRACLLAALALLPLAACGGADDRRRGTYDPRGPVVSCLREEGLTARADDPISIRTEGVRIDFLSTPGEAEARQISGTAQGAEQLGRALIWVGDASDRLLSRIEECVDR
jgi:hypothetical protein